MDSVNAQAAYIEGCVLWTSLLLLHILYNLFTKPWITVLQLACWLCCGYYLWRVLKRT